MQPHACKSTQLSVTAERPKWEEEETGNLYSQCYQIYSPKSLQFDCPNRLNVAESRRCIPLNMTEWFSKSAPQV
jgi:hypothetical protein